MPTTLYDLAQRSAGIEEVPGPVHHPLIQFGFTLCGGYGLETPDEVPWCSAWLQIWPWLLELPRSKSAAARSWLLVGREIPLAQAHPGYDVVILDAPGRGEKAGHVGFYAGEIPGRVTLFGGNQSDRVRWTSFPTDRVIGVRRLYEEQV